jgi:GNAT superfamily N-acetyltransferase
MSRVAADISIRPYVDADEPEVLALLQASLGGGPAGGRPPELFRWKHIENPFGRSLMLVAESEGRIVGLRAFVRWRFVVSGREVRAVRAVDTATHPDHQGKGIFSRLTLEALEMLRGDADLVFNTPNEKSLPGYLKMGWKVVGRLPVRVRVRRPIAFARRYRWIGANVGGGTAPIEVGLAPGEVLARSGIGDLLGVRAGEPRLTTDRSLDYLRWRYARAPLLGYRAVDEVAAGELRGLALFRIRPRGTLREASIADVFVREADRRTAGRLLRRIARVAPVDHLTCSFPAGSEPEGAALRSGFLPAPAGPMLVARTISDAVEPDPTLLRSWALSLGDVEVF